MIERRIERLTREVLHRERIPPTPLDEASLENAVRLVAIVVLLLLVFAFATWPRDDATQAEPVRAEQPVALPAAPAWGGGLEPGTQIGALEYSPIY
jgi:hypothetical protein